MSKIAQIVFSLLFAFSLALPMSAVVAAEKMQRVQFKPGSTSGHVKGVLVGKQQRLYVLWAKAGQTLRVDAQSKQAKALLIKVYQKGKNVGKKAETVFSNASSDDVGGSGKLSADGDYVLALAVKKTEKKPSAKIDYDVTVTITD